MWEYAARASDVASASISNFEINECGEVQLLCYKFAAGKTRARKTPLSITSPLTPTLKAIARWIGQAKAATPKEEWDCPGSLFGYRSSQAVQSCVPKAFKAAGSPHLSSESLRRGIIFAAVAAGATKKQVLDLAGWQSEVSLSRFLDMHAQDADFNWLLAPDHGLRPRRPGVPCSRTKSALVSGRPQSSPKKRSRSSPATARDPAFSSSTRPRNKRASMPSLSASPLDVR
eukprot:gnl/Ergobibamus_cyprinoides/1675.p1 GENE.gnl/Ergobibamus_cyprinoides/1675~~gnl/Ergobibamus_cyprinoides/1675.p1  ORF type:complete len:230 (+),score=0.53 gnl/Ergobibamus_cyprinoides/1675:222-911(+)